MLEQYHKGSDRPANTAETGFSQRYFQPMEVAGKYCHGLIYVQQPQAELQQITDYGRLMRAPDIPAIAEQQ